MDTSDRRSILTALVGCMMAGSTSCDSESRSTSSDKDVLKSAITTLTGAVDHLQYTVGEFDNDNWREVVPDVRAATVGIVNALIQVRRILNYND
jgi:hypothetical protein